MAEPNDKTVILWSTLHDGVVESLLTDLAARTLTFVVDSPFHRGFHMLPADTRIRVVGEGVRYAETFTFEPWPDSIKPPPDTPWKEAREQQQRDWDKGRYVSSEWNLFATDLANGEDHEILSAEIVLGSPLESFRLGIQKHPSSDWHDLEIRAERFRFFVAEREFTAKEFVEFGNAYWDAFHKRGETRRKQAAGE